MKYRTHITRTPPSRPTGGFFIPAIFSGEIRAELTEVNKPLINTSTAINYKDMIFPKVTPIQAIVNNRAQRAQRDKLIKTRPSMSSGRASMTELTSSLLMTYDSRLLCQFVELQHPTPTFCPLFGTGKAFAITFADDFQKKA